MTQIYLAHNGLTRNQEYDDRGRITSSYLNTTSGGGTFMSYSYEYDNYGNRTVKKYFYGGGIMYQYTWTRGRLLDKILYSNDTALAEYTYDANGVRYTKTTNGITTTYFYNGKTLLGENRSDGKRLRYFYDATGLCGFSYYNGSDTKYYTYVKDVLGNIVMIKDDMGLPLVKYTYNEWGVCSMTAFNLDNQGAAALELGNLNPFRYRGYYYDTECDLYYLMSRYYDPEIGQFISMDTSDYLAPDTIGGVDLYAYCGYNPIMHMDPTGHFAVSTFLIGLAIGFTVGSIIGGGFEIVKQVYNDGNWNFNVSSWDWRQIGLSALGGGVAGAISSISIGGPAVVSWIATFILGGTGSVFGGLISGSVTDWGSAACAFGIGAVANVAARGVTELINKALSSSAQKALNSFAFDDIALEDLIGIGLKNNGNSPVYNKLLNQAVKYLMRANGQWARSFMYSFSNASISSLLSGWY